MNNMNTIYIGFEFVYKVIIVWMRIVIDVILKHSVALSCVSRVCMKIMGDVLKMKEWGY